MSVDDSVGARLLAERTSAVEKSDEDEILTDSCLSAVALRLCGIASERRKKATNEKLAAMV